MAEKAIGGEVTLIIAGPAPVKPESVEDLEQVDALMERIDNLTEDMVDDAVSRMRNAALSDTVGILRGL